MPPQLTEWLENRKNKFVPTEKDTENATSEKDAIANKRRQKRLERMASGFEDLEIWLSDLIRQGLATTEGQAYSFWQDISARMVDSQIGGIGKKLKAIPLLHSSKNNWPEQILAEFAQFYLLAKAFRRLEDLPTPLQTELLSVAGINIHKKELLPLKGVVDEWQVLGIIEGIDDNLNFRRTWLYGQKCQKNTLILDFSFGDAGYETNWITGQSFEAELVYYPSSYPMRVIVKENFGTVEFEGEIKGFNTLESIF